MAGGILGKIGEFLTGRSDKISQLPTQTQGQQDLFNQLLQQLQSGQTGQNYGLSQDYLSRILSGDQGAYNEFAAPYMQNFEQQIMPRLAERFAGLTGPFGNPGQSSGFGQALGGAGAQLQAQLSGLHAGLQQQAAGQAQGQYNQLANQGLGNRSFENVYQPGNLGLLGGLASGAGQGIGSGLGMGLGYNMMNKYSGSNKASGLPTN